MSSHEKKPSPQSAETPTVDPIVEALARAFPKIADAAELVGLSASLLEVKHPNNPELQLGALSLRGHQHQLISSLYRVRLQLRILDAAGLGPRVPKSFVYENNNGELVEQTWSVPVCGAISGDVSTGVSVECLLEQGHPGPHAADRLACQGCGVELRGAVVVAAGVCRECAEKSAIEEQRYYPTPKAIAAVKARAAFCNVESVWTGAKCANPPGHEGEHRSHTGYAWPGPTTADEHGGVTAKPEVTRG